MYCTVKVRQIFDLHSIFSAFLQLAQRLTIGTSQAYHTNSFVTLWLACVNAPCALHMIPRSPRSRGILPRHHPTSQLSQ